MIWGGWEEMKFVAGRLYATDQVHVRELMVVDDGLLIGTKKDPRVSPRSDRLLLERVGVSK